MQPRGAGLVDAAKADGSWTLLDDVEDLVVPPDLAEALAADGARRTWEAFPRWVKRGRLVQARQPTTRATRVIEISAAAARGQRAYFS